MDSAPCVRALAAASLVASIFLFPAPPDEELQGLWAGEMDGPRAKVDVRARFVRTGEALRVTVTLVEEDATASADVRRDGETLAFRLSTPEHGPIAFKATREGDLLSGEAEVGPARMPFRLSRTADLPPRELADYVGHYEEANGDLFLLTWSAHGGLAFLDLDGPTLRAGTRLPVGKDRFVRLGPDGRPDETVHFERDEGGRVIAARWVPSSGSERSTRRVPRPPFRMEETTIPAGDGVELSGLLLIPAGVGPFPAVAHLHGSGANNTRTDTWDLAVCEHLARNGIAALIPDKRGSGRSGGDWRSADFVRLAEDARAAVRTLRARPEIRADRVGIVGLSQGGTIAPLVAARGGEEVAFLVVLSGCGVTLLEGTAWEVEQLARKAGADEEGVATILAIHREAAEWMRGEEPWEAYASAREKGTAGPRALRGVSEGFPATRDHWKWDHHRRIGDFDPLPSWEQVRQPVLLVWGRNDDKVPVAASEARLRALFGKTAHPDWTIRVLEGSGHALGDPKTGWIRRDFLDLLAKWIRDRG